MMRLRPISKNKRSYTMRFLSFSALFLSASVLAGGTLTIDGSGYATGVTDFYWGDSDYYDVSFEAGSYEEVYGASTPLFMNSSSAASEAADEVMALLNGTSPVTNVSSDPNNGILIPISLTREGCQVLSQNRAMNSDTGLHQAWGNFCYDTSDVTSPREYHLVFTLVRIRDSDGDGVKESLDQCPDTPSTETADETGCSPSQRDSDGDGVNDDIDQCPNSTESEVDETGCPIRPQIPVPVMPWPALLLLAGFIGLFGVRKSRG